MPIEWNYSHSTLNDWTLMIPYGNCKMDKLPLIIVLMLTKLIGSFTMYTIVDY